MSTLYLVRMPWGQELTVFEQNSGARALFAPDTAVDLHWNRDHAFLLDAAQDAQRGRRDGGRRLMAATDGGAGRTRPRTSPPPDAGTKRQRSPTGYLLLLPGALWLALFFVVPFYSLIATSLYDPAGSVLGGYDMTWHFANYADALADYWQPLVRSLVFGGIATLLCLLIGYPLAYAIAFKAGRWRNLMLVLVIAPFFTSFLIRTLSWQLILSDNGWVVGTLQTVGPARRRTAGCSPRRSPW